MVVEPAGLTAGELEAFRDLVADLGAVAAAAPRCGVEAAACQLARMRWARERVREEGEIVLDARDRPIPHPALMIEARAQAALARWVEVLRRVPAQEVQVSADPVDELARRRVARRAACAPSGAG